MDPQEKTRLYFLLDALGDASRADAKGLVERAAQEPRSEPFRQAVQKLGTFVTTAVGKASSDEQFRSELKAAAAAEPTDFVGQAVDRLFR